MLITMGAGDVVKIGEETSCFRKIKIILSLYLLPVENGVFLFSTGSFFAPNPHNLSFRQIVTHIFIHSYFPVFSPVFRVIHIVHNFIHIFTIHTMWIPCV